MIIDFIVETFWMLTLLVTFASASLFLFWIGLYLLALVSAIPLQPKALSPMKLLSWQTIRNTWKIR